jgi:hypothetical protein
MRRLTSCFLFATLVFATRAGADDPEPSIEEFRTEIIAALSKIDTDPRNTKETEKQTRADVINLLNKYVAKLRPNEGSKKFVSKDKSLVVVIAADGREGVGGAAAEAIDPEAKIVIAVAGNGSTAKNGKKATGGGAAVAVARYGVAVAVAGSGGDGAEGLGGGGGGGAATAIGGAGGIIIGGNGGTGAAGELGGLGGCKLDKPEAIVKAAKELEKK